MQKPNRKPRTPKKKNADMTANDFLTHNGTVFQYLTLERETDEDLEVKVRVAPEAAQMKLLGQRGAIAEGQTPTIRLPKDGKSPFHGNSKAMETEASELTRRLALFGIKSAATSRPENSVGTEVDEPNSRSHAPASTLSSTPK